jgi:uncharacterized membrane protein
MHMNIIVMMIIPLICVVIGIIAKMKPAKQINSVIGYRSARSRSSQENWDKAQQLMSKNLIILGAAELVITIIAAAFTNGLNEQQFLIFLVVFVLLQALGTILLIPMVESKL